ncbi:MAG: amidohydrolase family protein [Anaerolineae bacterium]
MVQAIDAHVHLHTGDKRKQSTQAYADAKKYFGGERPRPGGDELAGYYRSLNMLAVIFDVDAETRTGLRISNDEIAEAVQRHPDVLLGFGSVDPWKGKVAVREIERCIGELGLRGMKFQQATQEFYPNEPQFYPLWAKCQELGVPVLFHMGTTGLGAGAPGGRGVKLKYCRPIPYVDDVAADFPDLQIIAAHPGWPWHDELLAMARHKGNVWIDLSGWAPKYFPDSVVHYANSLLQDKTLFGSDYPLALSPERWLKEFAELPFKDEVRPKILWRNAARLFKLDLAAPVTENQEQMHAQ